MSAPCMSTRLPTWRGRQGVRQLPHRQRSTTLPYGLRQEAILTSGLAREFQVITSTELDFFQKLDCIVRDKVRLELPAVGVQFTTKTHDIGKMLGTLSVLRSSRPVSRAVYLIAETEIVELIGQLIRRAAASDQEVMIVAHLARNRYGDCCLDISKRFSLRTGDNDSSC